MAPSPPDFIFDDPSLLLLTSYMLSGSLESVSNFLNKSAFLHFHHHYLGPSPPMRIKKPRRWSCHFSGISPTILPWGWNSASSAYSLPETQTWTSSSMKDPVAWLHLASHPVSRLTNFMATLNEIDDSAKLKFGPIRNGGREGIGRGQKGRMKQEELVIFPFVKKTL